MSPEKKFTRTNWGKEHLTCPHRGQDSQRSTVSRTYLCFYTFATHRCMQSLCPLLER